MATIKSYTDLEQSKKLAEILPLESADAYYGNFSPKGLGYEYSYSIGLTSYIKEAELYEELKKEYNISDYNGIVAWKVIPAWSLAALLGVLPNGYVIVKNYHSFYYVESRDHARNTNIFSNPVDACVEMILKLHELKML